MPEKLHRCVNKVKGQKGVNSSYAICRASMGESSADPAKIAVLNEMLKKGINEGGVGSGRKGHTTAKKDNDPGGYGQVADDMNDPGFDPPSGRKYRDEWTPVLSSPTGNQIKANKQRDKLKQRKAANEI